MDGENEQKSENTDSTSNQSNWAYSSETNPLKSASGTTQQEKISWTASEFIQHDKNFSWYLILLIITMVVTVLIYISTKDILSSVVVVLAGGVFAFYANRKPRILDYSIGLSGITVGNKSFSLSTFKSYSVSKSSVLPNITMMPLKRFMPSLTIYLDPSSYDKVIDLLSSTLPQDESREDIIDKFTQKIRF